jgi:hypothetical protein
MEIWKNTGSFPFKFTGGFLCTGYLAFDHHHSFLFVRIQSKTIPPEQIK